VAQEELSITAPTTTVSQVKKGKTTPKGSGSLPFPREQLRQELLEAAGFDAAEKQRLLKKTLAEIHKALNAKKTVVVTHQGAVTEKVKVIDYDSRLIAAQKALDLLDVVRGKNEGGGSAPVKFVINFPEWEKPEPKVIEAQGTIIEEEP
jgi:hypothetical protein